MRLSTPVVLLAYLIGFAAVAGLVHIGTILAYPRIAHDDAFVRLSSVPVGVRTDLPPAHQGSIPNRDAAMAAAVCRYDLTGGPLQVVVDSPDQGFLSLGMHARHGVPFYGLNFSAGTSQPLRMVLMTEQQQDDAPQGDDAPLPRDLRIVAPEPEGFVMIEAGTEGALGGRSALAGVTCSVQEPSAPAPK